MTHLRALFAAGLVDSFGLALGWTVFVLHAAQSGGLGMAGALSAAMLAGVALSAPATTWLAHRVDGRRLLWLSTGTELLLRPVSFGLLLAGAPVPAVAAAVCLCHLAGWTSYAGMRAEVAATDARPATMTAYVVGLASVEALGAAAAALLPGDMAAEALAVVAATYSAVLLPTLLVATRSRVGRSPADLRAGLLPSAPALGAGMALTALAAGPTLLSAALALEHHGRPAVAFAAVAFTAGALLAPAMAGAIERSGIPPTVAWPALAAGMVAGWTLAPLHVAGLVCAQVCSGLSMSALEGSMDARLAGRVPRGTGATAILAWAASARALGGSVAVAVAPMALAAVSLGALSLVSTALLATAAVFAWLLASRAAAGRPAPATGG